MDSSRVQALAIGGSAGAVAALMTLLPALPPNLSVPVFVVIHLPPWQPSLLPDLFRGRSALPMCEAEDKQSVVPGTVYFAPPDYHLLIDRSAQGPLLSLSADEPLHFSRPAIDATFESAAEVYGAGLLALILTGASADGAEGLACVLRNGGSGLIQEPETAAVPTMPLTAAMRCPQATVAELSEIARQLSLLARGA